MRVNSLLVLPIADGNGPADGHLAQQPLVSYNHQERWLSAHVEREIDCLILGRRAGLILLRLYPRDGDPDSSAVALHGHSASEVRPEMAARMASDALNFFGPLHGGIVVQEDHDDVILQGRRFTTAYPHIHLERLDAYDAATSDPILVSWRAHRIQNLRRETRTNRMIDITLLALEIGKSFLPRLIS